MFFRFPEDELDSFARKAEIAARRVAEIRPRAVDALRHALARAARELRAIDRSARDTSCSRPPSRRLAAVSSTVGEGAAR
jgi:hypothetical protein